jgi:hypothetical protein
MFIDLDGAARSARDHGWLRGPRARRRGSRQCRPVCDCASARLGGCRGVRRTAVGESRYAEDPERVRRSWCPFTAKHRRDPSPRCISIMSEIEFARTGAALLVSQHYWRRGPQASQGGLARGPVANTSRGRRNVRNVARRAASFPAIRVLTCPKARVWLPACAGFVGFVGAILPGSPNIRAA